MGIRHRLSTRHQLGAALNTPDPPNTFAVVHAVTAALAGITVDCRETERGSGFWSRLLDAPVRTDPDLPGWFRLGPILAGGPVINVQPVDEEKSGKARIHFDLWVDDLADAIDAVGQLGGARLGEEQPYESGTVVVMADPEGNEFCLVGLVQGPGADTGSRGTDSPGAGNPAEA